MSSNLMVARCNARVATVLLKPRRSEGKSHLSYPDQIFWSLKKRKGEAKRSKMVRSGLGVQRGMKKVRRQVWLRKHKRYGNIVEKRPKRSGRDCCTRCLVTYTHVCSYAFGLVAPSHIYCDKVFFYYSQLDR